MDKQQQILNEMKAMLPQNYDTTEGSFFHDFLNVLAYQIAKGKENISHE